MSKVITAAEAADLINDGDTVAVGAFGLSGWPEEIAAAVEARFLATSHPANLHVVQNCSTGDRRERGITRWGHEGMIKRWMGAHIGFSPGIVKLITENKIEAYVIPQGCMVNLWREIGAGRPGLITKVGLGTFVDPRIEGGKMNTATTEDIYKVVDFEGEEYMFYKSFPVNVALLRGTEIDEKGNMTLSKDSGLTEQLAIATATKNSGGIVIAQAETLAAAGTLHPKDVVVPGILVDYIVIATDPRAQWQTEVTEFNPSFAGDVRVPLHAFPVMELGSDKVIARRAAKELTRDAVVNLGVGLASNVASVASEEGVSDLMTLTTEIGVIGGVPAGGQDFGAAYNPEAMIVHNSMFDFYDGGGLDTTFLGLAETDQHGNVNVSKFGRPMGTGGFVNITQATPKVVFTGTFTSGGLETEIRDGKLVITQEGRRRKFKDHVEQITFSGDFATKKGTDVLYVTERCVFKLIDGKMTIIEIAPGIDLQTQILDLMDFTPVVSPDLQLMDPALFAETWGALRAQLTA